MELNRRVGHGRLSEIFGEIAFDTDRLLRILGFGRAAPEVGRVGDLTHLAALLTALAGRGGLRPPAVRG